MGCGDEKLLKYLTQTFTAHCNAMICQQVTLSGDAEWPKVADAVIEADETFLPRMILVFMDLASGYLLMEEMAVNRTYDTWDGLVKARLKTLGVGVSDLVRDRAKALIKLAETGLDCLSIPDVGGVAV